MCKRHTLEKTFINRMAMQNNEHDVTAASQGDRQAFGRLYDAYVQDIYNFIYYKTHHVETAQDLTSQTFMKALRSMGRFDAQRAAFRTWLYSIARNAVIDHYRRARPTSNIEDAFDIASDADIERDAHVAQLMQKVQPLLAGLSAEQREIVLLRLWQGKSYREIADIIGKTEGACKVMFSRTMRHLQKAMPSLTLLFISLFLPRL